MENVSVCQQCNEMTWFDLNFISIGQAALSIMGIATPSPSVKTWGFFPKASNIILVTHHDSRHACKICALCLSSQNQLTFQSQRKITCYLVMWFLMQLRSCDFVGAIHDRVTNDAGAAEPARCRTLATIPTLILESLPTSTLPNRLDFKPTGKNFLGQIII